MKTLDEAIDSLTVMKADREEQLLALEMDEQFPPDKEERIERYESVTIEAEQHQKVDDLAIQLIHSVNIGAVCCVRHALIKAFCHGLRVGIEMEKSE